VKDLGNCWPCKDAQLERRAVDVYNGIPMCLLCLQDAESAPEEPPKPESQKARKPEQATTCFAPSVEVEEPEAPKEKAMVSRDEVVRLYESGMGATQIARQLGVADASIHYHLKKAGVHKRGQAKGETVRKPRGAKPKTNGRATPSNGRSAVSDDHPYHTLILELEERAAKILAAADVLRETY
jgi:hypothetical protein